MCEVCSFEVLCYGLQEVQTAWHVLKDLPEVEIVAAEDGFAKMSSRKRCQVVLSVQGYLATVFLFDATLKEQEEAMQGMCQVANALGLLDDAKPQKWETSRLEAGESKIPESVLVVTGFLRLVALLSVSFGMVTGISRGSLWGIPMNYYDDYESFFSNLPLVLPFWILLLVCASELLCCHRCSGRARTRPQPTQVWYARYFGVEGRHYAAKVAVLQLMTVSLQAFGKLALLRAASEVFDPEYVMSLTSFRVFAGLLVANALFPAFILAFPHLIISRVGAAVADAFLDLGYLLTGPFLISSLHFALSIREDVLAYMSVYIPLAHICCICRSLEQADWLALFRAREKSPWRCSTRTLSSITYALGLSIMFVFLWGDIASHDTQFLTLLPCGECQCSFIVESGTVSLEGCPISTSYELRLSGQNISDINPAAFRSIHLGGGMGQASRTTYLDLQNNYLTELPKGVFQDLQSLSELKLSGNNLTTLHAGTFKGLRNVRKLDLSQNNLIELPASTFDGLSGLERLYLRGNNLTTLHAGSFKGLQNILSLDLSQNNLIELPAATFDGLSVLWRLDLRGNKLRTLHAGTFKGLRYMWKLDFSQNNLIELPAATFDGLSGLERLDLGGNNLRTLHAGTFKGLQNIRSLDLSYQNLIELPAATFDGLSGLERLDLGGNNLRTLHAGTFKGLQNIRSLDLSYQNLIELPAATFDGLSGLGYLDLRGNKLTTLHAGTFKGL